MPILAGQPRRTAERDPRRAEEARGRGWWRRQRWTTGSTRRAPATGPEARSTELQVPDADSATARSMPASASGTRNATVGPEPETTAPSALLAPPHLEGALEVRGQAEGGGLQVVVQRPAERGGVAGAQRLHHGRLHLRGGHVAALAEPVALRVHRRGRQSLLGEGQHPVVLAAGQGGGHLVAAAGADGGAAHQGERDVRAELAAQLAQLVAGQAGAPERVAGQQRGGGVGGPAGHAAGDGDALGDPQRDALGDAGAVGEQPGGAHREVGAVGGHLVGTGTDDLDADLVGGGGDQVVVQRDGLEHGGELVEAVVAGRPDGQRQVHLRRHPDVHVRDGGHVEASTWQT